ncbi:hypothetical protein VP1G_11448 [Cytospora mali]|uniref:Uncharacterized protein n=1 Tax=Cytospora mali TaxID=578113 RepID=A0A194VGR2_CYTMA|nr:hypothetical protein VP1G_11448 [Valsa mali var. pyri (nom. inval.)]
MAFGISYHVYRRSRIGQANSATTEFYVTAYADATGAESEAGGISGWKEFGDEEYEFTRE